VVVMLYLKRDRKVCYLIQQTFKFEKRKKFAKSYHIFRYSLDFSSKETCKNRVTFEGSGFRRVEFRKNPARGPQYGPNVLNEDTDRDYYRSKLALTFS
jgi:hypothetical protein